MWRITLGAVTNAACLVVYFKIQSWRFKTKYFYESNMRHTRLENDIFWLFYVFDIIWTYFYGFKVVWCLLLNKIEPSMWFHDIMLSLLVLMNLFHSLSSFVSWMNICLFICVLRELCLFWKWLLVSVLEQICFGFLSIAGLICWRSPFCILLFILSWDTIFVFFPMFWLSICCRY